MNKIRKIYEILLKSYGPQGWWPLSDVYGTNPTKTGSLNGYHIGDYTYPKNQKQIFEICIGAIATQNTTWIQAEKVITSLNKLNSVTAKDVILLDDKILKDVMKPAGYFNQKTKKLKFLAEFIESRKYQTPTRKDLLSVWGVGDETADSILLYAFSEPEFVVDAYTKRIFSRLGFFASDAKYAEVKDFFETNLEKNVSVYQEYHALIVEHAKRSCLKAKPFCNSCILRRNCAF